jgi:hypothetical protein
MGFRCTLITTDFGDDTDWPDWFRGRYGKSPHIPDRGGPLASKCEGKRHGVWAHLHEDIRRCIDWDEQEKFSCPVSIAVLYECGHIARIDVHRDGCRIWEITDSREWQEAPQDGPDHDSWNFCHSCVPKAHGD